MKVAIFYNTGWYVYIFRRNLIRALQNAGCSVSVLTPPDDYVGKLEALGVEHVPVRLQPRNTNPVTEVATLLDVARQLSRLRPEYVLSYTIKCNLYAGLCNRFVPYRQVANISGLGEVFDKRGILNSMVRTLYRTSMKKAHKVFFQNREDLQLCTREGLVPSSVSELIPGSGIDLSHFVPSYPPVDPTTRRFLMFGRLLPRKGYREFLDAAYSLRQRHGDRAEFWILGKADKERAESMDLLADIRRAHDAGIVRYFEPTDNVLPILKDVDTVVLPSTYNEGVPRSLLEALACGKAVVTTDWKGCRDTVRDGLNGYLVRPGEQASLEESLDRVAVMSVEGLTAMGKASRRLAEENFDEGIVLRAYLNALGLTEAKAEEYRLSA